MKKSINGDKYSYTDSKTKQPVMPTMLIICFLAVYFLNTLNMYNIHIGQFILLILGFIGFVYTLISTKKRENLLYLLFFLMYTIFGLLSYIVIGNANISEYLWPIAFGGMAIILLNFKLHYKSIAILYYCVCCFYVVAIMENKMAENLTGTVSRNNISVTMLIFFSLLCITSFVTDKQIHRISAVLGLVITVWALGRSGIITFGIICIGFFIFEFKGKGVHISNPIKIFSLIGIIYGIGRFNYNTIIVPAINNFQAYGMKSPRLLIWETYLRNVFSSVIHFVFGAPLNQDWILIAMDYNLHNSFLHLHSRYGIFITMLYIVVLLVKLHAFIKRKNIIYVLLLIAIIFRISFDLSAFNGGLDIIIYYFMFEGLYNKKSKEKNL